MNRDQWLAERKKGLGASDAASALNVSPWKSQRALYEEKCGNVDGDDLSDNEAVRWGNILEEPIRKRVGEILGQEVFHDGPYAILRHPERPWMTCTLDGYIRQTHEIRELFREHGYEIDIDGVSEYGTVQIKTTSQWNAREFDENWPLHYQVQCQHELVVAGYGWGILAVLIGGQELRLFPFVRNEPFCTALLGAEAAFWKRCQDHDPPEADGSASTIAVLNALYPADTGGTVELPDESLIWDAQLQEAKATRKEAEETIAACEAKIKDAIGEAAYGVLSDGTKYSWKTQQRKAYSVEAKEYRVLRRVSSNG